MIAGANNCQQLNRRCSADSSNAQVQMLTGYMKHFKLKEWNVPINWGLWRSELNKVHGAVYPFQWCAMRVCFFVSGVHSGAGQCAVCRLMIRDCQIVIHELINGKHPASSFCTDRHLANVAKGTALYERCVWGRAEGRGLAYKQCSYNILRRQKRQWKIQIDEKYTFKIYFESLPWKNCFGTTCKRAL